MYSFTTQEKLMVEQTALLQSREQISICRGMVFIACNTEVTWYSSTPKEKLFSEGWAGFIGCFLFLLTLDWSYWKVPSMKCWGIQTLSKWFEQEAVEWCWQGDSQHLSKMKSINSPQSMYMTLTPAQSSNPPLVVWPQWLSFNWSMSVLLYTWYILVIK